MTNTKITNQHTQTSPAESCSHLMSLINNDDYDWQGNCIFDSDGNVIGFKYLSMKNTTTKKPIPSDKKTIKQAQDALMDLSEKMKPATHDQIALHIKRLSLHCGLQSRAPEEVKYMFMDYCEDLQQYPDSLIAKACKKWRTMPDGNSFLPSSGKLISLIESDFDALKKNIGRLQKIVEIGGL